MKKITLCFVVSLFLCQHSFAGNYTLDIVNIDEVGANNRLRFSYPAIAYNVVVAAEGGDYPYIWELTGNTTCNGASIDADDGEIGWLSPSIDDNGCTIEVKVTDASSNTDTESYTVTVTNSTDRFLFVQDGYSGTKSGSISQPYENLSEIWDTVDDTNKIVYFRSGTYTIPHAGDASDRNNCSRVPVENSSDPIAFIGYPGETATIDAEGGGGSGYAFSSTDQDIYFENIAFENIHFYGVVFVGADYITIYNCSFGQAYTSSSPSNQSYINYMSGATSDYNVISHNTLDGAVSGGSNFNGCETYTTTHHIFQYNTVDGMPNKGLYYKDNTDFATATKNRFLNNLAGFEIYSQGGCANNEIRFNFFKNNDDDIYTNPISAINPTYFIRNSFYNTSNGIELRNGSDVNHTCSFVNNAIQNPLSDSGSVGDDAFYRHRIYFRYFSIAEYNSVTFTDNIEGSSGIVDADGFLVNREYVGTYGWETDSTTYPSISGGVLSGVTIGQ
jgi:hypothetical protein